MGFNVFYFTIFYIISLEALIIGQIVGVHFFHFFLQNPPLHHLHALRNGLKLIKTFARAAKEGRPIPEGWAVDENGQPTTDPVAALKGALLPFGGLKGYCLSFIINRLSGA